MNIAICDDDKTFREFLKIQLNHYFDKTDVPINMYEFDNGEKLLNSEILFDLTFLDVEMGNMNGIDAGRQLKQKNSRNIIFIITSYSGYLDDAFNINAFRYLQKPLDILRLYRALDDAIELMNNDIIVFYDTLSCQNIRIYASDIIFIEIERKKTKVVTCNGVYVSNQKISYWKEKLNGIAFVCPHSSFIANLDYAIRHTRSELVLAKWDAKGSIAEKYTIPIAPKKQAEIKRLFFYVLERR